MVGDRTIVRQVEGFRIRIAPYHDKNDPDFIQCRAVIRDQANKTIFSDHDFGFKINLTGKDINGDGVPDVVLESYSGGAHCCWTYYIISLGPKPGLITQVYNERPPIFVENKRTGKMEMHTLDGSFDYFDFLSHAETIFPQLYLRLDGRRLLDISPEYRESYNEEIQAAKHKLGPEVLKQFHSVKSREELVDHPNRETAGPVLAIILAYLYSGRRAQAHGALQQMWPAFDQERMWKLILKTRKEGMRRYTAMPKAIEKQKSGVRSQESEVRPDARHTMVTGFKLNM